MNGSAGRQAVEFGLLGALEVWVDGAAVPLPPGKLPAMLALLLLQPNEVVSSDRLIDALWDERPPRSAFGSLQVLVSRLRRRLSETAGPAAGASLVLTRPPGYLLAVRPEQIDVVRFERLVEAARVAAGRGDAASARDSLDAGLALWRGDPLADFAFDAFARPEIARLEEARMTALEERVEADLALARHAEVLAELRGLVARHPLRERLRSQLMLTLYRCGLQAEALEVYRDTRTRLAEELGIEPSRSLARLETRMLQQDPSLDAPPAAEDAAQPARARSAGPAVVDAPVEGLEGVVLLVTHAGDGVDPLIALAEPLAAGPGGRDLVITGIVAAEPLAGRSDVAQAELSRVTALLRERRDGLQERGVSARVAAFISADPGRDLARLARQLEVDLILGHGLELLGPSLADIACDAGILVLPPGTRLRLDPEVPLVVPFGGGPNDWAALELGTWLAGATGMPLRLVGATSGSAERPDASRLLASASLVVQRFADVDAEPILSDPGPEGVVRLSRGAGLLLIGLSDRWREEGLGEARAALVARAQAPLVLARRGPRSRGAFSGADATRFDWSMTSFHVAGRGAPAE